MSGKPWTRWHSLLVVSLVLLMVSLWFLFPRVERQTAYYNVSVVQAYDASYCPGDVVIFDIPVYRLPVGQYEIITKMRRSGLGLEPEYTYTRLDLQPEYAGAGMLLESRVLPDNLTPGQWELLNSRRRKGTEAVSFVVIPFEIRNDCPQFQQEKRRWVDRLFG